LSAVITQSLAYPRPLQGSYYTALLPSGFGYPIGTPAATVDNGVLFWTGELWSIDPPNFGIANNVLSFGADPTGVVDSSYAFQEALNSSTYVYVPPPNPGRQYIISNVIIPGGVTLFAYGAYFQDKVGAEWMFKLTGYSSRLLGAYISTALNCSQAVIIVDGGTVTEMNGVRIYNCINGYKVQAALGTTDHTQMTNCYCDTFTGIGFFQGQNCSELRAVNCYMDAGLVAGTGGLIPRAGTTGWAIDSSGSTVAFGGNYLTQCQASNSQDGFYLNNTTLAAFTQCTSDNNSGRGFAFDGTTNICEMTGCYTGPAAVGLWAGGTVTQIWATGLTTIDNGTIPGGYGSNFFTSAESGYNGYTPSGTYYDVQVTGTADIAVDAASWMASQGTAHVYNVASGANLGLTGALQKDFTSAGTIGAATAYIGPAGQQATDGENSWVAPYNCVIQQFHAQVNAAPGAGQSFTYTLNVGGVSSALTGTISGASQFSLDVVNGSQVALAKGTYFTLKVVGSGGAANAYHNGYLLILPQP
jgi:hypothetical protein